MPTSTCGAATRRGSTTCRSCVWARSRTSDLLHRDRPVGIARGVHRLPRRACRRVPAAQRRGAVLLPAGAAYGHVREPPICYIVIDRWESPEAYTAFLAEHADEYLRRSDEARFYYLQELRMGTFENLRSATS